MSEERLRLAADLERVSAAVIEDPAVPAAPSVLALLALVTRAVIVLGGVR